MDQRRQGGGGSKVGNYNKNDQYHCLVKIKIFKPDKKNWHWFTYYQITDLGQL